MKNVSDPENSVFRKKGFFIALYSCLGVVAILAVVVTLANRPPAAYEDEAALYVGAGQPESYHEAGEEAWFRPRQTPEPQPVPTPAPQPSPPREAPLPDTPEVPPVAEPPEPEPEPAPPPTPVVETFEPFTAYDRLLWPVYGEIVMPFSQTALVFNPTLDRFSTNDNLRIAAREGDPVRAGADGKVISVGRDFWRGNYVKIDHGNGWVATLGQLMENALVSEGDIVRAGQVVGGIGQPSMVASLTGSHAHLFVTHDDVPVNPYYLLE